MFNSVFTSGQRFKNMSDSAEGENSVILRVNICLFYLLSTLIINGSLSGLCLQIKRIYHFYFLIMKSEKRSIDYKTKVKLCLLTKLLVVK